MIFQDTDEWNFDKKLKNEEDSVDQIKRNTVGRVRLDHYDKACTQRDKDVTKFQKYLIYIPMESCQSYLKYINVICVILATIMIILCVYMLKMEFVQSFSFFDTVTSYTYKYKANKTSALLKSKQEPISSNGVISNVTTMLIYCSLLLATSVLSEVTNYYKLFKLCKVTVVMATGTLAISFIVLLHCIFELKNIELYLDAYLAFLIRSYVGSVQFNLDCELEQNNDINSKLIDDAMRYFRCCGLFSFEDFALYSTKWNRQVTCLNSKVRKMKLPIACCKTKPHLGPGTKLQHASFLQLPQCLSNADVSVSNTTPCRSEFTGFAYNLLYVLIVYLLIVTILYVFALYFNASVGVHMDISLKKDTDFIQIAMFPVDEKVTQVTSNALNPSIHSKMDKDAPRMSIKTKMKNKLTGLQSHSIAKDSLLENTLHSGGSRSDWRKTSKALASQLALDKRKASESVIGSNYNMRI